MATPSRGKPATAPPAPKAPAAKAKAQAKVSKPAPVKSPPAKTAAKTKPAPAAKEPPPRARVAKVAPAPEVKPPAAPPAQPQRPVEFHSKVSSRPVTKSKASTTAPDTNRPASEPAAEAQATPRPSIVIAAPTDTPSRGGGSMAARAAAGRPNMPPSFAVRSPGRPGFAEGQNPAPRPPAAKIELKAGDHVVYPTHGVGMVQGIETIEAAGHALQMVVVTFEENRMTLRVPVTKVATAGLRKLFTPKEFEQAIDTLKGRARIKRTMWSRRAQEYEAKINSGDPIQIAEVVRDLQRNAGQPDQSFSERQIYEQALERLAAEYAAIEKIDRLEASDRLVAFAKSSA